MGAITGFNHVGIQVRDVERSTRFYTELLGLELVSRFSKDDAYVQRVVGYHPDVVLEVAILRLPDSKGFLEILEYRGVERTPVDPATANPGTSHLCFFVDDLDALYERLTAEGVEFVSPPETPTSGMNLGGRLVYMKDPDGIRVELAQSDRRLDGSVRGAISGG
jgi:catechol 2,3-dioxygenase-like lactoylglutathione lyase family enzyme